MREQETFDDTEYWFEKSKTTNPLHNLQQHFAGHSDTESHEPDYGEMNDYRSNFQNDYQVQNPY